MMQNILLRERTLSRWVVLLFWKASLWNWNCIWRTSLISQIQRLCRCALPSVQMNFLFHFWPSFQLVFLGKRDGMHSGSFTFGLSDNGNWLHETTKRLLDSLLTWSWSLCQVESSSTWSSRHYKLCVHLWSEPKSAKSKLVSVNLSLCYWTGIARIPVSVGGPIS